MFRWGKKKEEENQEFKKEFKHIAAETAKIHKAQERHEEQEKESLQKILAKQSKQSLLLEELLEVLEEEKEDRKEKEEQREKEHRQEKEKLAEVIISASEYLYQMERQMDNAAWEEQIRLVRSHIGRQMYGCGIQEIAEADIKAEPSLHEVMEEVITTEEGKDKNIKEVLIPGYLYKEKVKNKAKVIIYSQERC